MEQLADKGNGNYAYLDSTEEAKKVLLREAGATLVTVAKDVKLQVEWNPVRVASYRLIGYENRTLAKQDFRDDKKDAGELGAGKSVTAFYEIVPHDSDGTEPVGPALKYQTPGALSAASQIPELATVNIRFKAPAADTSRNSTHVIADAPLPIASASSDFRFGAAVATAALLLRGAPEVRASLKDAHALAARALGADRHGDRKEFLSLLERAESLSRRPPVIAAP